jgi:glycosyltransferase involved in cell wall biosynthesis
VLVGDGPERKNLTEKIETLSLQEHVVFKGVLQSRDVAKELSKAFTLILPSYEEQFGNVVIEAQAMGLPTIISSNCGAADSLVQSGVNGFVFEANNSKGLAYFMSCISNDKTLWMKLAYEAQKSSHLGDSARFAEGVLHLATRK